MSQLNDEAGLEQRSTHKIRKTVISRLIESGLFSSTQVKERAGHKDFHTTQRYYANTLDGTSEADKIGIALNRVKLDEFFIQRENPTNP